MEESIAEMVDIVVNVEDRISNSLMNSIEEKGSEFKIECRAIIDI